MLWNADIDYTIMGNPDKLSCFTCSYWWRCNRNHSRPSRCCSLNIISLNETLLSKVMMRVNFDSQKVFICLPMMKANAKFQLVFWLLPWNEKKIYLHKIKFFLIHTIWMKCIKILNQQKTSQVNYFLIASGIICFNG